MPQMNTAILGKISLADIVGRAHMAGYEISKISEDMDAIHRAIILHLKHDTSKGMSFDALKIDFFEGDDIRNGSFAYSDKEDTLPTSSFDSPFVLVSPLSTISDTAQEVVNSIVARSLEPTFTFSIDDEYPIIIPTETEKAGDISLFRSSREVGLKAIIEHSVKMASLINDDLPFLSPVERDRIVNTATLSKQEKHEPSW